MRQSGFSLIELMLALVILAILFGIALPSYSSYAQKARRADGKQMVTSIMQAEERYFANNLTYSIDLKDDLGYASATGVNDHQIDSTEGYYKLTMSTCPAPNAALTRCILITAVAQGAHTGDTSLTLTSMGAKTGPW